MKAVGGPLQTFWQGVDLIAPVMELNIPKLLNLPALFFMFRTVLRQNLDRYFLAMEFKIKKSEV